MSNIKMYAVGGWVRDHILGMETNDLDFTVVAPSWDALVEHAHEICEKVWVTDERFFTVRGRHAEYGDVDLVWARKEGAYSDGRRPDTVEPGTLQDDLARRDFTVNAMAVEEQYAFSVGTMQDPASVLIDPFGGFSDLLPDLLTPGSRRTIKCVGDPFDRFSEDGLRPWRALRFSITHGMNIDQSVRDAMCDEGVYATAMGVASERVQQEMAKAAKRANFGAIVHVFSEFPEWAYALENTHGVWLKPTLEGKPF